MVAYLEKSDDNTEFHQIVEFFSSCSITYALTQIHAIVDGRAVVISESLVRSDILFDDEDGITCLTNDEIFENLALMGYEPLSTKLTFQKDEAVNREEGDIVERAITTDTSLEAVEESDNITKTQTMAMPNPNEPPFTEGHTSGSGEGRLEETIKLTDTVPTPYDSPLTGGYTPGSDEGRITLAELMKTCTTLSNRVTQLEIELLTTKALYNKAFITLTNREKKLESQLKQKRRRAVIHSSDEEGPSVHIEYSPKQGRIIEEMDKDENINLVSEQGEVPEIAVHLRDDDDETLAETLLNIKRSSAKDKGKGIMQET
nr:hypothetical protein [Tanacetum cinerariifolium]